MIPTSTKVFLSSVRSSIVRTMTSSPVRFIPRPNGGRFRDLRGTMKSITQRERFSVPRSALGPAVPFSCGGGGQAAGRAGVTASGGGLPPAGPIWGWAGAGGGRSRSLLNLSRGRAACTAFLLPRACPPRSLAPGPVWLPTPQNTRPPPVHPSVRIRSSSTSSDRTSRPLTDDLPVARTPVFSPYIR